MIPVYVNDIKHSLQNKCYFSALALSLALPDICGMAEFPNKTVAERYTEWYDKYLGAFMAQGKDDLGGNNPWLSGEIIYNLRNAYLHQGNPGIANDKVKAEENQLDKFVLLLGDGTVLNTVTINIEAETQEKITFKSILVDVTYLCTSICDTALWYYKNSKDKFRFDFNVITEEEFMYPSNDGLQSTQGDVILKLLNEKLETEGSLRRFIERENYSMLDNISKDLKVIFSDEDMKGKFLNGEETIKFTHPFHATNLVEIKSLSDKTRCEKVEKKNIVTKKESKKKSPPKSVSKEKKEAQIRSFFGRKFKKQIYVDKKEVIIQAVLKSKTKTQVKNNLLKYFSSEEVSIIHERLQPLIKNLPEK